MSHIHALLERVFDVLKTAQPGEFDAEPPIAELTLEAIRAMPLAEQDQLLLKLLYWGTEHRVPEPIDAPIRQREFRL